MATISQIGPGRKTNGTIDGITYVTRNGVTYVRSVPTMPASAYTTPAAKKHQAIFKMVQMHLKYHLRTIRQTFTPKGNGTPTNRYYSVNSKALSAALDTLAEQYAEGQDVTLTDVESAISDYATEHPSAITIASKSGYQPVHLTGPWPNTITLYADGGDKTMIIIVAENGSTTTINADGTTTTESGTASGGSGSGSSDTSGSDSGQTSSGGSDGSSTTPSGDSGTGED